MRNLLTAVLLVAGLSLPALSAEHRIYGAIGVDLNVNTDEIYDLVDRLNYQVGADFRLTDLLLVGPEFELQHVTTTWAGSGPVRADLTGRPVEAT